MKEDRYEEGRFSNRGQGLGTVTEEMVRLRASELAVINGRGPHNVLDRDLEQAWRELTGREGLHPAETRGEALEEEKRWDPIAEGPSEGLPVVPAPDEQTFTEKLVEEGIEDAEHDQMLQATRESLRRDQRE